MTEARRAVPTLEDGERLSELILELQARGLRINVPFERRPGGAGPSDAGMIWIEGTPVTVPVDARYVGATPFTMEAEDSGHGIYRDGVRVASATPSQRPRFYDLETADGTPYWKLAIMHLDSLASTVLQTCAYWGNDDQCRFCGIGVSLASGSTVKVKTARAARRGGGGGEGPRRRRRHHPDHGLAPTPATRAPSTSPSAARP